MTTLKLPEKTVGETSQKTVGETSQTAQKPPVRRAGPARRQHVAATKNANRDMNIAPTKSVGAQLIARKEPKATDAAPHPENQRQRNHRFDGKPRQAQASNGPRDASGRGQ